MITHKERPPEGGFLFASSIVPTSSIWIMFAFIFGWSTSLGSYFWISALFMKYFFIWERNQLYRRYIMADIWVPEPPKPPSLSKTAFSHWSLLQFTLWYLLLWLSASWVTFELSSQSCTYNPNSVMLAWWELIRGLQKRKLKLKDKVSFMGYPLWVEFPGLS